LAQVRSALTVETLGGDSGLEMRIDEPGTSSVFVASEKDPHDCWVLLNVDYNGTTSVVAGAHSVEVIP
jgi:hypothetical protein